MTTQHIETLIIGAGQAGLSTGYHLQRRGRPFLIVDGNERVGDNWRQQWDTLRLYTPAKYDGLPGPAVPGRRRGTSRGRTRSATTWSSYALHFDLPVRMSTRVDRLEAAADGGYVATIGADTITCDNVVVATGTLRADAVRPGVRGGPRPVDPAAALQRVPPARASSAGPVLVVGASHSGTDIAYEVAADARRRSCAGRDCGQIPVRWSRGASHVVLPVIVFMCRHVLTRRTPIGRKEMDEVRFHGGPDLRVKRAGPRRAAASSGSRARVVGVADGRPVLDDGTRGRRRATSSGAPASGRSSTGSSCRSWRRRLAGGVPRRRRRRARAVLLRAELPVRVQLDGASGRRPRRRLRRRAGSPRAHHGPRGCLTRERPDLAAALSSERR